MYGNSPLGGDDSAAPELSPAERKALRRDLSSVAARTRELLPGDFVVGSELSESPNGPQARIAVQPPIGAAVSAGYAPDDSNHRIDDDEREDLATGLAASAALQVKQAYPADDAPPAQ
jgi:hypothetical protein